MTMMMYMWVKIYHHNGISEMIYQDSISLWWMLHWCWSTRKKTPLRFKIPIFIINVLFSWIYFYEKWTIILCWVGGKTHKKFKILNLYILQEWERYYYIKKDLSTEVKWNIQLFLEILCLHNPIRVKILSQTSNFLFFPSYIID